jgi:hypothetical protein
MFEPENSLEALMQAAAGDRAIVPRLSIMAKRPEASASR